MLMSLPNEVILLVAERLPTSSLNELSLTSKATCDILSHELYKRSTDYEDGKWEHPLIWAVEKGAMTMLEKLIPYNKTLMATAALRVAADLGNEEAVAILLNAGADPFYTEPITKQESLGHHGRRRYTFERNSDHNHVNTMRILLRHRPYMMKGSTDQMKPTNEELRPIHYAFQNAFRAGNIDVAELILTETVLEPSRNTYAELLTEAFQRAKMRGMSFLYNNRHEFSGAPNKALEERLDPGSVCILDHDHEFVNCIWGRGSVLHNMVSPDFRYTHRKIDYPVEDIFKQLVSWGADVESRESIGGHTPLHTAARLGDLRLAKCLLDHGANVDSIDRLGVSPLILAARMKQCPMVEFLLEHGADVNLQNARGNTALHLAAWDLGFNYYSRQMRRNDVVKALFAYGADENAVNWMGATPVEVAMMNGPHGIEYIL